MPILFLKARVRGHIRHMGSGKTALVMPYNTRVGMRTAGQGDLFTARHQAAAPAPPPPPADMALPPAPTVTLPAPGQLVGRATYPDGRQVPVAGDEVFQTVRGPFGTAAHIRGDVEMGTGGLWVRITGSGSLLGGGTSRQRDRLTDAWTVAGDPELQRRRDAQAAAEQAALDLHGRGAARPQQ